MIPRPTSLLAILAGLALGPARAALIPDAISGVTAKARQQGDSADPNGNGGLNNVVNGNGLTVGDPADPNTWIHEGPWQTGWQGNGSFVIDSAGSGSALTPGFWFIADLGAPYTHLREMRIWNVRESGATNRGTRNVDLFHALNPSVAANTGSAYDFNSGGWTLFRANHNIPQNLTAGPDKAHDVIDLSGLPPTRYIGIRINSNYNSNFRVGFAEIQFTRAWVIDPPVIQPLDPAPVYATRAGVSVNVLDDGGEAPEVTVFHGASDGGTNAAAWAASVVLTGTGATRSGELAGLVPGQTRFHRARAVNSGGTTWAATSGSFTPPLATAPSVVTHSPSQLTGLTAQLRGTVTDFGGDPAAVSFFLGPTDGGPHAANWADTLPVTGLQTGFFARAATGLQPETPYFYRARAQNAAGETWSDPVQAFFSPAYVPPAIVINEIHVDEADATVHAEFIELHNPATNAVDVSGWFFDDGINFVLPAGTVIPAGGYLVLAENPAVIQAKWGLSGPGVISWQDPLTPRVGSLRNGGERLRLRDAAAQVVDEVEYRRGYPWPTVGDPPSPSLELLHPSLDNNLGGHWRASNGSPTPGAPNSVLTANAPPASRQVVHTPVGAAPGQIWPASGQPLHVSVKVSDPDGVASVLLHLQVVEPGDYLPLDDPRYEAPASWTTLPMRDDGTNGDPVAGDEMYTAVLPGETQVHRRLLRTRITVTDTLGASVRVPYADDPQPNFATFVYDGVPDWTASRRPGVEPTVTYPGSLLNSVRPIHLVTRLLEHANSQVVPVPAATAGTQNPTTGTYTHSDYNWKGALCHEGRVYDHIRFRSRGGVWRFAMGKNMWKFDFNRGHEFLALDNLGQPYGQPWKKLNFSAVIQQGDYLHRGEQGLFESVGFRLFQLSGLPAHHTTFAHFRVVSRPLEDNGTTSQFDDDFQGLYLAIEQPDGQFLDEHGLPEGNFYKMEAGTGELNHQGPTQPKNKSDLNAFLAYGTTEDWWRTHADLPGYYNYRAIVDAIHHYDIGDGKNYYYYHNPDTARWTVIPWDLDLTWANNMYRADANIAGLAPSTTPTEPFFSRIVGNGTSTGIPALRQEFRNRVREILDLLYTPEQVGLLLEEKAAFIYQPGQPSFVDADRAMWDYNPILTSAYVNGSKAGHGRFYQSAVDDPATPADEAGTFPGMIRKMKDYVDTRRAVMLERLITPAEEALVPSTPVAARLEDSSDPLPANQLHFTTSAFSGQNGATFAALQWRIAEITDPNAPGFQPFDRTTPRRYEADPATSWTSPEITAFAPTYTFPAVTTRPGLTYRVRVRHADHTGRWSHWSAPVSFTAAAPDVTAYRQSLMVSQIHYNPALPSPEEAAASPSPGDYEWLEILNVGAVDLDLNPVRFTKGIDFNFADGVITNLAPGARAIVVKHLPAFEARYGAGLPVAGTWQDGDNLSNNGETVKLSFGAGEAIQEFDYDDNAPWPEAADNGFTLVLVHPESRPDHRDPANWRASLDVHGRPGEGDAASFAAWAAANTTAADPELDENGDGVANLAAYFLGGRADQNARPRLPTGTIARYGETDHFTLTFRHLTAADDLTFFVELSDAVTPWTSQPARVVWVGATHHSDGTTTQVYRSARPVAEGEREFFRLRLQPRTIPP
jgi:hypothetical protein